MVNKAMVEKLAEQVFTVLQEDIIMVILVLEVAVQAL
tara:strand:- start:284 stop:394 length:111 start_codon:yes stop_codon:yes gene_type:complete